MLALNGVALRALHEAWRRESVRKTYLALVSGKPLTRPDRLTLLKTGERTSWDRYRQREESPDQVREDQG